jgi:hypothetical protein
MCSVRKRARTISQTAASARASQDSIPVAGPGGSLRSSRALGCVNRKYAYGAQQPT